MKSKDDKYLKEEIPHPIQVKRDCLICTTYVNSGEILVNGETFHKICFNRLMDEIARLDQIIQINNNDIFQLYRELNGLIIKIKKSRGMFNQFKKAIGTSFLDENDLWQKREKIEIKINESKGILQSKENEYSSLITKLTHIYDYWPTYPPDWDHRTAQIRDEVLNCQICNGYGRVHVHHKNPIRNGGNHRIENLVLTCEKCHGEIHERDFSVEEFKDSSRISQFAERLTLINTAIDNNKELFFHYRKFSGEKTKRTFKPEIIERIGRSLCVRGYCYLRNDKRVFAIRRMSKVRFNESKLNEKSVEDI